MQVFSDDGACIDVRIDGSNGDPIVLISGFPLTREIWNAQAEALSRTHRVDSPRLTRHGKSSVPEGPYLMEVLAADVAVALDALGIEARRDRRSFARRIRRAGVRANVRRTRFSLGAGLQPASPQTRRSGRRRAANSPIARSATAPSPVDSTRTFHDDSRRRRRASGPTSPLACAKSPIGFDPRACGSNAARHVVAAGLPTISLRISTCRLCVIAGGSDRRRFH